MDKPSGLLNAGTILLLIGAIVQSVGAFFLLLYGTLFGTALRRAMERNGNTNSFPATFLMIVFLCLGLLLAAGAVLAFLAHARARAGNANSAFVRGLIAALLPPVQIVTLIGAILCKASPEAQGLSPQGPPGWQPHPAPQGWGQQPPR